MLTDIFEPYRADLKEYQRALIFLGISTYAGTYILWLLWKLQHDSLRSSERWWLVFSLRSYSVTFAACMYLVIAVLRPDDPIAQPALRCVCFFYVCKMMDLAWARASDPPQLLSETVAVNGGEKPAVDAQRKGEGSFTKAIRYCFLLFTEMRYHSFNISIHQKGRPGKDAKDSLSPAWTYIPPVLIPLLTYLLPTPETKALLVLLLIQLGLESLHTTLHIHRIWNGTEQPLFYKPFAAATLSTFWATHWHASAAPYLRTLGYEPGKKLGGRWLGVLATFNLTGIWHAWCAAPLVEEEYGLLLAFKVWALFMVMGVGILLENVVWRKERQGGVVQRVLVWGISLAMAGWAYRTLEAHSRIPLLRGQ